MPRSSILFWAGLLLFSFVKAGNAEEASEQEVCKQEKAQLENIEKKYKPEFDKLQKDGDDLLKRSENAKIIPTFDVKVKVQHWIFLTQRVKIGQTPNLVCDQCGGSIKYQCNCQTYWTDNYIYVAKLVMQRQYIMGFPSSRYDDIPVLVPNMTIKINMADWFVKIPEITLRNVTEEAKKELQEEAQKLQTEGNDLKYKADSTAQAVKSDSRNSTANLYDCIKNGLENGLVENRHKVEQDFGIGMEAIEGVIDSVKAAKAAGGDPIISNGVITNYVAQLTELTKERDDALQQIDQAIADLNKKDIETVNEVDTK